MSVTVHPAVNQGLCRVHACSRIPSTCQWQYILLLTRVCAECMLVAGFPRAVVPAGSCLAPSPLPRKSPPRKRWAGLCLRHAGFAVVEGAWGVFLLIVGDRIVQCMQQCWLFSLLKYVCVWVCVTCLVYWNVCVCVCVTLCIWEREYMCVTLCMCVCVGVCVGGGGVERACKTEQERERKCTCLFDLLSFYSLLKCTFFVYIQS